jgi:hypothetical protein
MKGNILKKINLTNVRFKIYYSTVFKVKTYIRRITYRFFKFNRPTSYSRITGDGFRALAQHIYDDCSGVNTSLVVTNDIVFVRSDLLYTYIKKVHPKINYPYILISHNSDKNITGELTKYIDNKIIHWFGQNILINSPKISPIPIGLSNFHYKGRDYLSELSKLSLLDCKKNGLVLSCFSEETSAKRQTIKEELKKYHVVRTFEQLKQEDYLKTISEYKFIASPEGNGIDCHRTWEAMYLKSIPIVERNVTTEYFEKIGLPIVLINDWKELETWSEEKISQKYNELKPKFDSEAMHINYWFKLILNKQNG